MSAGKVERDRLNEAAATLGGALSMFVIYGSPFIIFGTISGYGLYRHGPFAPFLLSKLAPNFMHPGATNLAVFSFCCLGVIAAIVAIVWRYIYHRKTLQFMRERGVSDFDRDGRTDNFADDFLDDL
jgi:hypothetical protein